MSALCVVSQRVMYISRTGQRVWMGFPLVFRRRRVTGLSVFRHARCYTLMIGSSVSVVVCVSVLSHRQQLRGVVVHVFLRRVGWLDSQARCHRRLFRMECQLLAWYSLGIMVGWLCSLCGLCTRVYQPHCVSDQYIFEADQRGSTIEIICTPLLGDPDIYVTLDGMVPSSTHSQYRCRCMDGVSVNARKITSGFAVPQLPLAQT